MSVSDSIGSENCGWLDILEDLRARYQTLFLAYPYTLASSVVLARCSNTQHILRQLHLVAYWVVIVFACWVERSYLVKDP